MAKKRKVTFIGEAASLCSALHAHAMEDGVDYDALASAAKSVATAAGFRKATHRRKTLSQMIEEREIKAAAKAAAEKAKAERQAKAKAARAKRAKAKKEAEKA